MLANGETPKIEPLFFDSEIKMILSKNENGNLLKDYVELDTLVKATIDSNVYEGTVNSMNTIKLVDTLEIITIPTNNKVEVVESGFIGTLTIDTENKNMDLLYNALDFQKWTSLTNLDGFSSVDEADIFTVSNLTFGLKAISGVIDGLGFNITENQNITLRSGDALARIDLVVLKKNQLSRTLEIVIKESLPSSNPIEPSLIQASLGEYEIPIFRVYVNALATSISRSEIVDLRTRTSKNEIIPKRDLTAGVFQYTGDINYLPDWILYADGSEVSRTKYNRLFSLIGTMFGDGDGVTTFNLPDWRDGVFIGTGSNPMFSRHNNLPVGSSQDTRGINAGGQIPGEILGDGSEGRSGFVTKTIFRSGVLSSGNNYFVSRVGFDLSYSYNVGDTFSNNGFGVYNCIIA